MTEIGKVLFNMQKLEIIKTKLNPQTKDFLSDAYVYAWSVGVYPLFDDYDYSVDLEEFFPITKSKVSDVISYLNSEWLEKKYYTFYQIEDHFDVLGSGKYSREDLIYILRYTYLHNKFDKTFWDTLVCRGNNPCEAETIVNSFDQSDLL